MEDLENVLMELATLEKNPQTTAISGCLEEYLAHVAKTGNALFAWAKVKPLFKRKLELIIQEFQESSPTDNLPRQPNVDVFKFDQMKERIFEQLESYTGIPFTVQRLCELMVQPKKHYKRTDKFMRGLEKIMLVVSTIDPNPNLQDESSKQESSECCSFESPSKRIRLASGDDEPGPCDSADEASAAGGMESVAGPSSKDDTNDVTENGVNGDHDAAIGADDGGEENMDIDTECTSSQARLSVTTEPSTDDSAETGVESSAAAEVVNNVGDDNDNNENMETETRDNQPETGVESSSAAEVVTEGHGGQTSSMADDGVTTSAASSDNRPAEAVLESHEDTNSEAEPAEAEHDNVDVGEAAPDPEVGVESDQSDQVVAGDNVVDNTDNTVDDTSAAADTNNEVESAVQSSEQTSNTASDTEAAPSSATDTGDRGAADSSDEVQQMSAEAAAADDGGQEDVQESGDVGEAGVEDSDNQCQPSTSSSSPNLSTESSHQSDNNSPDQSDTSVQ